MTLPQQEDPKKRGRETESREAREWLLSKLVSKPSATGELLTNEWQVAQWLDSYAAPYRQRAEERDRWEETAAQFCRNVDFYRGIVVQIGEMFGQAAHMSDDGSIQEDVLALKVPELVNELRAALSQRDELLRRTKDMIDNGGRNQDFEQLAAEIKDVLEKSK